MQRNNEKNDSRPGRLFLNLAIVGGGRVCKSFLELLRNEAFDYLDIRIAGVCDINPEAEGLRLAKEMGIYTTNNFQDLLKIKGLHGVIELTNSREVLLELIRLAPKGIGVLEHNFSRLLGNLFQIDQRLKSAEQQVLLEKMVSDFLIHQANERIVVLNPDFTIVEANEAYLMAVEESKNDVIGAHCYEITHGLSAPCSTLGCPMVETLRTGESAHVIHEHPASGDESVYCDLVTYPVRDQAGEIIRVIEIWRDITEALASRWEKRVKALKADTKKLIQEDRMMSLGKLVASCVHEINNPIQGLLTFSGLMLDILEEREPNSDDLENFKKYLSMMFNELERCGNIVSGLLSFSREPTLEYTNVDLNAILEAVISLTRHRMELQEIHLNTNLSPKLLMVRGDANQLQQCFLNLIFNAIEAMPQGGQLSIISELERKQEVFRVEIQDTGCGIQEENLDHIFDPFFTTKEEGEGTGLGLSIVYGVVKNHRGNIDVNSHVGKGSTFILDFPTQ